MDFEIVKDEVVISGVGGFFPKSNDVGELKARLLNNENLLSFRWTEDVRGVSNQIGTVPIDLFDNSHFGIHRQQSFYMDPMQRLVLEGTFQALIDAGVNPSEIRGKKVGVFMGSSVGENDNLFLESVVSGFGITGHSRAMLPNRVSYWLNLHGPSVAYDSNWIGGIEVLRMAYDSIKTGQCEAAIVGTANLALNCEMQWIYDDMGLMSKEGRTKAFDADAEGYTRSDGVVVLYIQKQSSARRSYASIVHIDACFLAPPVGNILTPSTDCMTEFLEKFFSKSKVRPEEVDFVEAYGCGLKETDKCEVDALDRVYCKNRKEPLWIGSIKTNTGHSEASAALFSVVKVLIAMEAGEIPANLHYSKPNPEIKALVDGRIKVLTENKKWNGLYAAVNAIGLDSYYGHVILKTNKKEIVPQKDDLPRLVLASTRTEEGIKSILETLKSKPRDNPHYFQIVQDLFAKTIPNHLYRGYAIFDKEDEKLVSENYPGNKRQVWFVYTGMGSQWPGMLSDLMRFPVFAESIRKSAEVLKTKNVDLMNILTTKDPKIFDNILHSFVGIAAMQIGLTDLLHAIGIKPDGIIGHSVGELGCAYADGCLTAEEMILCSYSRGRASVEAELIPGMMAAVGLGYQQIKDRIPPTIEVACHNGPDSSTLSGPKEDMEKFVKQLQDEGVFARLVNVANIAYHSRYIKPAAPLLLKYLQEVIKKSVPRSSKWISTSNRKENWETDLAKTSSPEYHTNNLLSSVLFEEGLKSIPKDAILIEIAPHGLLQAILKRSVKQGCTNIPLTQRGTKSAVNFLLDSLGKMYLAGIELSVSNLYPDYGYPVGRGTPSLGDLVHWNHTDTWRTGLESKQMHNRFGFKSIQVTLNSEEFRDSVGNQFNDKIFLSLGHYLNIVYDIFSNVRPTQKQIVFEDVFANDVLVIPKIGSVLVHAMVQKGSGRFEISAHETLLMTGKIRFPPSMDNCEVEPADVELTDDDVVHLTANDVYNELHHRGHKYSGQFKHIKGLTIAARGSVSVSQWNLKWNVFLESMIQQALLHAGEKKQEGCTPKHIQKIVISLEKLPQEKQDLKVVYDFATNIISTEGIQIIGLKTVTLQREVKSNYFDCNDFIPLHNVTYTSIENGINVALQLTLDNFPQQDITNIFIMEIKNSASTSLIDNIRNVCSWNKKLNPTVVSIKNINQIVIQESLPLLIVYDNIIRDDVVSLVTSSHAFLLVRTDKNILSHPQIVQVAQFNIGNISYSIIRKVQLNPAVAVHVKGDTLSIKDLSRSSISWVNELHSASGKSDNIYLISNLIPIEGFLNFMHEIRSQPQFSNIKLLFNTNKHGASELNDPAYQLILKQGLSLTVIRDGIIGSYLSVPLTWKENPVTSTPFTSNVIKGKEVNYVGINLRDETINVKSIKTNVLGNIDYSGLDEKKNRVMGLATLDKDCWQIIPDTILTWNVPEWINLEDAATIPHAYTSAFYALVIKGEVEQGDTVLIHAGCSALSLALIHIAHSKDCQIFVTVSTDEQRNYLKSTFPFLNDGSIFSSDTDDFAPALKLATSGKGANVILNCLSGSLLQESVECLALHGRFVQYGKYDLEEGNNSIGMHIFLKNTAFAVVNFERMFLLPNNVKQELKQLVEDGLKNNYVKPIIRKVVEHQNISEILNSLNKSSNIGKILIKINNQMVLNKLNIDKPTQFICDSRSSYLVYGGSVDQWIDVVEWLILRGAKKIIVSTDSKIQQISHQRRITLLESYFNTNVVVTSQKCNTRDGAAELLSETYMFGPIHGVFNLPQKPGISRISDSKSLYYLDLALRTTAPKAFLVNFNSLATGLCYLRSEAGFNSYNVEWMKDVDFSDVVNNLDDLFFYQLKSIHVKVDKSNDIKQETTAALFRKLNLMIPPSKNVLINQVKKAANEPELVQVQTLSPKDFRGLIPMFVIPGLNGEEHLQEFLQNLMFPTFRAVLPAKHVNMPDLAAIYVKKIREIWPQGPYNLVGISWGGILAIEIARQLNRLGAKTNMHFLDAAPNTLQMALKHLGDDEATTEAGLLTRIINIRDPDVIQKLKVCKTFDERLQMAVDYAQVKEYNRKYLEDGLKTLRQRLNDVFSVKPNEHLINGKIYLIRPNDADEYDNCGLTAYCKTIPQIRVFEGDHLAIVSNIDSINYINKIFNTN